MAAAAPSLELLAGRLFWAPGGVAVPEGRQVPALDLCKHGGGKAAAYAVVHYRPAACAEAFGPLGLGDLLRFCRGLDAALEGAEGEAAVVLSTPKGDSAYRLNALVFLGAYALGKCGWSTERLAKAIGADASAKFICSWSSTAPPEEKRVMRVRDCWAGLELAMRLGWLDVDCMTDDAKMQAAVSRHTLRSVYFDVSWLIPGLLMVGSDPTTVVLDPNPATCKTLLPSQDSLSTTTSTTADSEPATPPCRNSVVSRAALSVDTVCKEYDEVYDDALPLDAGEVPSDFASFLVQSNVGIVVRVNYADEPGMPQKSYDDEAFKDFGIVQANIRILDTEGGLPKARDAARMIEVCEEFMKPGTERPAVFVHCKGGFGRSAMLAVCLAIYRFDVPGAALLGWIRVARPGAVNTRKQEVFLRSLGGRRDVERFAQLLPVEKENVSSGQTCTGCSLQ